MRIIILLIAALFAFPCWARDIATIPHTENFDAASSVDDLLLTGSCGTVVAYTTTGCYSGGCVEITPPSCTDGQVTQGLGGWGLPAAQSQLNVRLLIKIGSTYWTTALPSESTPAGIQNKFIIATRGGSTRQMTILESGSSYFSGFTWGVCKLGTNECWYPIPGYTTAPDPWPHWYPRATSPFQTQDYSDQWVCVEFEYNNAAGVYRTYVWTLDGTHNGLYAEITGEPEGQTFIAVQVLGGFFNGYHTTDANNHIMIDNVVISNTYIGPPAGFAGSASRKLQNVTGVRVTLH